MERLGLAPRREEGQAREILEPCATDSRVFCPTLSRSQEKEKLKLQLKKCLRITDELHLECLEEAMKKPRKSEGGKKEKGGAGYGSTDKIATKKRKSTDKSSRKVCLPSTSPAQSTESCSGAPQQSVFPGETLAHAESLALSPAPLLSPAGEGGIASTSLFTPCIAPARCLQGPYSRRI